MFHTKAGFQRSKQVIPRCVRSGLYWGRCIKTHPIFYAFCEASVEMCECALSRCNTAPSSRMFGFFFKFFQSLDISTTIDHCTLLKKMTQTGNTSGPKLSPSLWKKSVQFSPSVWVKKCSNNYSNIDQGL